MKNAILKRALTTALIVLVMCLCLQSSVSAQQQQGTTTRYVYDGNGRLHAVIAPSGEAVVYEYDAAGNLTAIRRVPADALEIFSFSPHEGSYGDLVTFIGSGFGGGVTSVSFNGTTGRVVEFTPSTVVAEVPQGATSGFITITTPTGSATTIEPFSIRGVKITPQSAVVTFADSLQFTAVIFSESDQSVIWSVNGIEGGNASVGTITPAGLYTAPSREASVSVRATSVADPTQFGEAVVRMHNPSDIQSAFAAAVSVIRGENVGQASVASPVSVQYGVQGSSQMASSGAVSVQYGNPSGVSTAFSRNVSVQRGDSSGAAAITQPGVSVRYGSGYDMDAANSPAVSAITGAYITSLTPASIKRGATVTLTINGTTLGGATALRFIDENGSTSNGITASNISVNAEGTTLTATINVSTSAALGSRIVVVSTPNGDTVRIDLGTNKISIVAQ
ncbi:MAG TPA: IPT/TIG domain-containing protein [Pyrinomonadaceae bacterium]|nr:IPT/TIG domain-containing protein [Pyrinomonadaceae bacterium]